MSTVPEFRTYDASTADPVQLTCALSKYGPIGLSNRLLC